MSADDDPAAELTRAEQAALELWKRKREWESAFLDKPLPETPKQLLAECRQLRAELIDLSRTTNRTVAHAPQVIERLWDAMRKMGGAPPPPPSLTECSESEAFADRLLRNGRVEAFHQAIDGVVAWCEGRQAVGGTSGQGGAGQAKGIGRRRKRPPTRREQLPKLNEKQQAALNYIKQQGPKSGREVAAEVDASVETVKRWFSRKGRLYAHGCRNDRDGEGYRYRPK